MDELIQLYPDVIFTYDGRGGYMAMVGDPMGDIEDMMLFVSPSIEELKNALLINSAEEKWTH